MSLVRDCLAFLFGCGQAVPLNYGRRLKVVVGAAIHYWSAVDGGGVLVKEAIRALGAEEDHQEGARQEEDEQDSHEDTLAEACPLCELPVLPDDVRGLGRLLNIDLVLVQPYELILQIRIILTQLFHSERAVHALLALEGHEDGAGRREVLQVIIFHIVDFGVTFFHTFPVFALDAIATFA